MFYFNWKPLIKTLAIVEFKLDNTAVLVGIVNSLLLTTYEEYPKIKSALFPTKKLTCNSVIAFVL